MSSGAVVPYHQRQNKHVERHLFLDLLRYLDRWQPMESYLYVGFGGIYFEDFKLLHWHFGIDQMLSIEQEEWLLARQGVNVPYGCISRRHLSSGELVQKLEEVRAEYSDANHLLMWLDYSKASELAEQLNEVRALVPKLEAADVLKVTLSANPRWLNSGTGSQLENRLENLKTKVGAAYLADGLTVGDVTNDGLPEVLLGALKRKISEGMMESPRLYFQPVGCYLYRDSVTMVTATGIVLHQADEKKFMAQTNLDDFEFSSLNWQLHRIDVPDLSLQEKLMLDKLLFAKTSEEISQTLTFQLSENPDESLELISNYKRLYRYYPVYHRLQL